MTQQEFEHIYYSIKADLIRLAGQFCRSASIDLDAEDAVQETEPMASDNFPGDTSASSLVEMADERIIKQRLYDTLTRTERLYMLMKSEQGLSLDEMMRETGGSRASVKMALSKAKKKLEEQLKKMGYGK